MKLNKITTFIFAVLIFINTISVFATETQTTTITVTEDNIDASLIAETAVIIDKETGLVYYDKKSNQKMFPASITKVMTCLLVLENCDLSDEVTFSHNAVFGIGPGSSHIGMREGEKLSIENCLYGMLLGSANEVCMAVAEHISGDVDSFVNLMNSKAKEIGCVNTHFNNPHGYHDTEHYTTAYDMALIMKKALENETFVKIISTYEYYIPKTNLVDEERPLHNTNKLINPFSPYENNLCVGGKTGFTDEAGNTLVTYGKKNDKELITVVMKSKGFDIYTDTSKLYEYGFNIKTIKNTVLKKEDFIPEQINVIQKFKDKTIDLGNVNSTIKNDIVLNLPEFIDDTKVKINLNKTIEAPVTEDTVLGSVDIFYNEILLSSENIYSDRNIEPIPEEKLLKKEKIISVIKKIVTIILIIISVVALLFLIYIIYLLNEKRKIKKRRQQRYLERQQRRFDNNL